MRIVAGSHKGATIRAPSGKDTRPTPDRVREAVFNLVGPVDGMRVLDLYAGSGAMGLEALSRGAAVAVLVDHDLGACQVMRRNVETLGTTGAQVVRADALRHLEADALRRARYDLVLIDPPYRMLPALLSSLDDALPRVLAPHGRVVVESARAVEPALSLPIRTSRRYGSTRVTVFEAPAGHE